MHDQCHGVGHCDRCGRVLPAGLHRMCLGSADVAPRPASVCRHLGRPTIDTVRVLGCGCPSMDASGGAEVAAWECARHGSCVQVGTDATGVVRSCRGCVDWASGTA